MDQIDVATLLLLKLVSKSQLSRYFFRLHGKNRPAVVGDFP